MVENIAEGYKKTDVGVIPEDWDVKSLDEMTILMTNGFVGVVKQHYVEHGAGVLYIQGYNVEENSFNFHGIKKVNSDFHKKNMKSCLQEDDLLTVQTGNVGLTTLVPKELAGSNCHALIISRFQKDKYSPKFFSFYFNSHKGRSRLKEIETGSTMKHINVGTMKYLLVPIPHLPEQQAIATVICDIGNLISSLEKLIDKKKNIKQGAIQELLTGKKRLDGFIGDWSVKCIGNIGKTYGGLTGKIKGDFGKGNSRYIPFMNVISNPIIDLTFLEHVNIENGEFQNNVCYKDLFFNTSSETPEEVGMCSVLIKDIKNLYLNSFCFGFRLNNLEEINPLFLAYLFRSNMGRNLMFSLAQGMTRYNLSKNNFNKLEIKIPEYKEQTEIAQILLDIDTEIEKLNEKLNKYKEIKQGMMQELLTGKRRLI